MKIQMTKSKIQNKSKCQMPNFKTKVLSFGICVLTLFCHLCFDICHYSYAQDYTQETTYFDLERAQAELEKIKNSPEIQRRLPGLIPDIASIQSEIQILKNDPKQIETRLPEIKNKLDNMKYKAFEAFRPEIDKARAEMEKFQSTYRGQNIPGMEGVDIGGLLKNLPGSSSGGKKEETSTQGSTQGSSESDKEKEALPSTQDVKSLLDKFKY